MFDASFLSVLVLVVAVVSGIIIGFILKQSIAAKEIRSSKNLMARMAEEAKKEAETIKKEAVLQAKENLLKMKAEFDAESKERRNDFEAREKRIRTKEENLDKKTAIKNEVEGGVLVKKIRPGGAFSKTRMQDEFIITNVNGVEVKNIEDLGRALARSQSESVNLEGFYDGFDGMYRYPVKLSAGDE